MRYPQRQTSILTSQQPQKVRLDQLSSHLNNNKRGHLDQQSTKATTMGLQDILSFDAAGYATKIATYDDSHLCHNEVVKLRQNPVLLPRRAAVWPWSALQVHIFSSTWRTVLAVTTSSMKDLPYEAGAWTGKRVARYAVDKTVHGVLSLVDDPSSRIGCIANVARD